MEQETEPLQEKNEDKSNSKSTINNTKYCYCILFIIIAIITI